MVCPRKNAGQLTCSSCEQAITCDSGRATTSPGQETRRIDTVKAGAIAIRALIICLSLAAPLVAGGAAAGSLRVYLPRSVPVTADRLTLDAIAIVRASDQLLAGRASAVALGPAPKAGESIVITRRAVLDSLAAAGIDRNLVKVTGAEKVTTTRKHTTIPREDILKAAEKFLQAGAPGPEGSSWVPAAGPMAGLTFPTPTQPGKVELRSRLVEGAAKGRLKVHVAAFLGAKELAGRNVIYKAAYPHQRAVAVKPIAAGQKITQANTEIRTVLMAQPEAGPFSQPFGLIATVDLDPGRVIPAEVLVKSETTVVVKRNRVVEMKIVRRGFTVSAIGMALQDGRIGQVIRVRNVDTRRTIAARVAFDGTVRPIVER